MPELPEVETVRRGLVPVLVGRRLVRVVTYRPDLRVALPDGLAQRLTGRRLVALGRRSKYLLWHFDDGTVLIVHLGMSGRVQVFDGPPPPRGPHDHVVFETDAGATLRYRDPRRFGLMALAETALLDQHPLLAGLGSEPLEASFDGATLAARLRGRRGAIKNALMDQSVVAGLGNIYASESLFHAGLSPRRRAGTVQGRRAGRLAGAIRRVLGAAIAAGGSSLNDHRLPSGELGYFQLRLAVYGREGEACPGCVCERPRTGGIRRIVQSGRSTFYCATCQR